MLEPHFATYAVAASEFGAPRVASNRTIGTIEDLAVVMKRAGGDGTFRF